MKSCWAFFTFIIMLLNCFILDAHGGMGIKNEVIVNQSIRIPLDEFPNAHNPSLIRVDEGLLLIFRYLPDNAKLHISRIGTMMLDEDLNRISAPQLLDTRLIGLSPSQSEDSRIFVVKGELYLIFTDNLDVTRPSTAQRRDMYLCKLHYVDGDFFAGLPVRLYHETEYHRCKWQKNWVGFDWHGELMLIYAPHPHEILYPDLRTGECLSIYKTQPKVQWEWGTLRGGTAPIMVDGEYLAFFHSAIVTTSIASKGKKMWHYYMGAYTFAAEPPFAITSMSPMPIAGEGYYTQSNYEKRVVFPGGVVDCGDHLLVAFGKDDREVWISKINKASLKASMVPVSFD